MTDWNNRKMVELPLHHRARSKGALLASNAGDPRMSPPRPHCPYHLIAPRPLGVLFLGVTGIASGRMVVLEDFRQGPAWRETDEPADLQTFIDDLQSPASTTGRCITEPDRSVMEKPGSSPKPLRPVSVEPRR